MKASLGAAAATALALVAIASEALGIPSAVAVEFLQDVIVCGQSRLEMVI